MTALPVASKPRAPSRIEVRMMRGIAVAMGMLVALVGCDLDAGDTPQGETSGEPRTHVDRGSPLADADARAALAALSGASARRSSISNSSNASAGVRPDSAMYWASVLPWCCAFSLLNVQAMRMCSKDNR